MSVSEEIAALRADLERVQRESETALRVNLERMQKEKEADAAENEAKFERLRRERPLGPSFDEQGGGGSADRRGTAAPTMGSMWTRGVRTGGGLGQSLPYVPRGTVPKFPMECPPYVYIAWERHFHVFITNQGLGHTISPDATISARLLSRSTDGHGGTFVKLLPAPLLKIVFMSITPFLML